jgi:hypothetical protein
MTVLTAPDKILGKILNRIHSGMNIYAIDNSTRSFEEVGLYLDKLGFTKTEEVEFLYSLLILNFERKIDYTTKELVKPKLKSFTGIKTYDATVIITEKYYVETYLPEIVEYYIKEFAIDPDTFNPTDYDNFDNEDIIVKEN